MPRGIEKSILSAIIEGRIKPGDRLSETQIAEVFEVSRTLVREALKRLEGRHIISVSPRRGWFVNAPSAEEASQVYATRKALESGFLRLIEPLSDDQVEQMHAHLAEERAAIETGDRQGLTYLMGDFHTRLVEITGNAVLAEMTRNLTARTMLISMCFQSNVHALQSHEGHCRILAALELRDHDAAARAAIRHLEEVETGLILDLRRDRDPLAELRRTLRPDPEPQDHH